MILWLKSDFRHLTGFRCAYTLVRKVLGSAALWQSGTSDTGESYLLRKNAAQVSRTQIPSIATPVSSVVHVSPADAGSARVSVPVVTISPAASGGLT